MTATNYIPDVTVLTNTIASLGLIITAFASALPGPILSLVIPFVILGAIVGLVGMVVTILPRVVNGALGKIRL